MTSDEPIAYTKDGNPLYDNTPTVVCVALYSEYEVLAIRRVNSPGKNQLALPGGYHMRGETWQECGSREIKEEIGLKIKPIRLDLINVTTDHYQNNVILAKAHLLFSDLENGLHLNFDEVSEVKFLDRNVMKIDEWAFPLHYAAARGVLKD